MKRSLPLTVVRGALNLLLCLIACAFSDDIAFAQLQVTTMQTGCPGDGAACPEPIAFADHKDLDVVKNQPYEAQAITEVKRTLADGSHIDQTATAMVARDSDGRTVRTQTLSNGTTATTIIDPVARTHTDYTSEAKVAHVVPLPTTLPSGATLIIGNAVLASSAGPAAGGAVEFVPKDRALSFQMINSSNTTTESLGTKVIEGIQVVGTRSTSTIPAGAIGNDKDLTTTREVWRSAELKLDVLSIQDDPRLGQTTYALSNIQRSEPEAALFQVPRDYKIEEPSMSEPSR